MGKISNLEEARLLELATEGDDEAQLYLGCAYDRFGDLNYDPKKAEHWLRQASASGRTDALRRLARFCVVHEKADAIEQVNKLILMKDVAGHYLMGHILLEGTCGMAVDKPVAIRHLQIASDMGHLISKADLMRNSYAYPYLRPRIVYRLMVLAVQIFNEIQRRPHNPAVFR